ncbi:MAG: ECF transporter S component, partial [Lachnospiraceae bacterium]|nr:ECF transporter S component [Lachnospiraceae bacterium]
MKKKVFDLTAMMQLAMLICIQFVMKAIGLGSVPVGPLYMSFLTLPIAVGAMIIGPEAGAILGGVFGLVRFKDALTVGSVMTSTLFAVSPIHTFILCVVTRVLMGYLAGVVFKALAKLDKRGSWSYFVGAIAAPVLNTVLFMGYLVLAFYNTEYVQGHV